MVFLEALKKEVKRKAHYKCCLCASFGFIEVHHIIPQADDGSDTFDNAAPLCVPCHDTYGGNPEKRKWIIEKRDFWYDYCEKNLITDNMEQLEKLSKAIEDLHNDHETRLKQSENKLDFLQNEFLVLSNQYGELLKVVSKVPENRKSEIVYQIGSLSSTISGTAVAISGCALGFVGSGTTK